MNEEDEGGGRRGGVQINRTLACTLKEMGRYCKFLSRRITWSVLGTAQRKVSVNIKPHIQC